MELSFVDVFSGKENLQKAKKLYESAFPSDERMPFSMLEKGYLKGIAEFLAVYEGSLFVGIIYVVLIKKYASVFYFAVGENLRGKGFGSRILSAIKERYPNRTIFLDIEKIDEHAENNELRLRRKNFYLRNGFSPCGLTITEFGVTYEILAFGGSLDFDEYKRFMKKFTGKLFYYLVYRRKLREERIF